MGCSMQKIQGLGHRGVTGISFQGKKHRDLRGIFWSNNLSRFWDTQGVRGIFFQVKNQEDYFGALILLGHRGVRGKCWGTNHGHLGRTLPPRLSPMSPKATIEVPAFLIKRAIKGSLYMLIPSLMLVSSCLSPGSDLPIVGPVHVLEVPHGIPHITRHLGESIPSIFKL